MKVADLFVDIGIKGNVAVKNALGGVLGGLNEVKESSFAVKAGIFGAVVALEEITRRSVTAAVDLKNFAGATGLSTQELQKWGYWAEINDVKAEAMADTIRGLQSAQSALRLGQGVPAGAVYFGLNQNNNPIEMMNEIQKKLRAIGNDQKEIGNARTMAATLGITDTMFAALRIGTVGFSGLTKEMTLTNIEQEKLLKLNREWHMFWETVKGTSQKTIANELSAPLAGFVHAMKNSVTEGHELIKMLQNFGTHSDVAKAAFVGLGVAATAAFAFIAPWSAALGGIVFALDQVYKMTHNQESILTSPSDEKKQKQGVLDFANSLSQMDSATMGKLTGKDKSEDVDAAMKWLVSSPGFSKPVYGPENNPAANTTVTVNAHINGAQDPQAVVDILMDHISDAYHQNASQNSLWNIQKGSSQ